jgi:thiosulfate reductase cytochrome b subunit
MVLAPYNLVSAWYWVYGDPVRPVPFAALQAAWFENDDYAPTIRTAFDTNVDGELTDDELIIDTEEKEMLIAERLQAHGIDNPYIAADVEAYAIHHNVTHGEWAINDCDTCHSSGSRLNTAIKMADRIPGNVEPTFIGNDSTTLNGNLSRGENGALFYERQFDIAPTNLYVLGKSNVSLIDWLGALLFLGTVAGIVIHGGLRYLALRRMGAPEEPELQKIYMYTIYERQWHWLQTVVIFGLIFTGLVIHKPDMFSLFSFGGIVLVHNALALILVVNAALAAFYHLVSGEIRQFLPEPRGFFGKMFSQTKYYIVGIFRGEPHPFEKSPQHKMNPIQQITYFGLLNVLLPLQLNVSAACLSWHPSTH